VDVADDGPSGVARARALRPDLVILDLTLPGMDGFRVLKAMRDGGLDMPVLILTARGEEADKVYGFRLGADDYVTKPFGLSELLARVGALLRRTRAAPGADAAPPAEELLRFGDVVVNPAARVVLKRGERVALTPKEFDLLLGLVRRPGVVHSRVTLLREVWGHQADILTRTVDIHVAELRRKLEDVPARPRYFVTVWKAGYRFDP
jgi:two-component system response regulator MtrA